MESDPSVPEQEAEKTVGDLAEKSDRLEQQIDETRQDWEAKRDDDAVPGAPPHEEDAVTDTAPGAETTDSAADETDSAAEEDDSPADGAD